MNSLFNVWLIGMEVSLVWITLIYSWVAFNGDSFLFGIVQLAIAALILLFSFNGVFQRVANRLKPVNLKVVLITKGLLAVLFAYRWFLLAKIKGIIATGNQMTDVNLFAVGSSFVVVFVFFVYELYLLSKQA